MKTGYKDINGKDIFVWDKFKFINKKNNYTATKIVVEKDWVFWAIHFWWNNKWDWSSDKFIPLEKFIRKHWVEVVKTKQEIETDSKIASIQYKKNRIIELKNHIIEFQNEIDKLEKELI